MTEDSGNRLILTKVLYKEIFMEFYKPLCLFARKILSNEEDAEDVVHNVFLAIGEKRVSFASKVHLKAYLFRAVYNQSVTCLRRQRLVTKLQKGEEEEEVDCNNYLRMRIESEVFLEIMQAIERLPKHRREIFKLSYVEGMKVSEVAERLGVAEETVRSQRVKARKQLQAALKDIFPIFLFVFCSERY